MRSMSVVVERIGLVIHKIVTAGDFEPRTKTSAQRLMQIINSRVDHPYLHSLAGCCQSCIRLNRRGFNVH